MIRKLAFISSLGIILLIAGGCQNKTGPENTQKSAVSTSSEHESVEQGEGAVSSAQDEDVPPQYVDESKYSGDELAIVKLMNARMRYLYEQDEEGYMSLFTAEAPFTGKPGYKIRNIFSMSEITITEQRNIYQATVKVTELRQADEMEYNQMMVFWKKKADGDAAQWKIADID
ncbi:hypothetical protein [Paenibacillus silvae]|uniref:hypothetical protein n=1 Tax=Paenibacillus silvae TaxID=1325358 RepID=UPI0020063473|nr:hypothetical protein [Paenibacillus silvae]MCK6074595.1 hypothetical protein [Paenibacillus silvae]MCK6147929.1 hypothetical protein [Paenibacillus silvae]MCK6266227.1 hypothetical protein [Paenibacillus silvae]